MASYYPTYLNLSGKKCVILGGGTETGKKLPRLIECGADITVVTPKTTRKVLQIINTNGIRLVKRTYQDGDLQGAFLAIDATNDNATNEAVSKEAIREKVVLNVVDVTNLCDFIAPAVVVRGEVTAAISTGGASPALARKLREELEASDVMQWADLLNVIRDARAELRKRGIKVKPDRWQECIDGSLLTMAQSGKTSAAIEELLKRLCKDHV